MTSPPDSAGNYVVVARRYRPQGFEDLVGQSMVSQALRNAIETDRVGHAYLFTGARGVGKTSTARIISKALNCETGPTPTPCHKCDICESIASGDDVDVLEIDGASNRGIDEIRQLRSNINVRPSRSRYKIYIIDEVHMLTKEAFNALLKTLEEPPGHVKFIFCTTDPEKIPITVLSRCQRFDFAPVSGDEIVERLKFIVKSEGAEADDDALRVLARKASGSVRDSQSLLEQLMSFTSEKITLDAVHNMLGTAGTERLHGVLKSLATRDACAALQELDQAIGEGVDAGQLAEQLLGVIRDLLALSVGGGKELMLHSAEAEAEELAAIANSWGTPNLLAASQIIDEALARMRMVTHSRVLLEMALIRIAKLEDLQAVSELISQLASGVAPETQKKKVAATSENTASAAPANTAPTNPTQSAATPSSQPPPIAAPEPTVRRQASVAPDVRTDPPQSVAPAAINRQAEEEEKVDALVASPTHAAQVKQQTPPSSSAPVPKEAGEGESADASPKPLGNSDGLSGKEIWQRTVKELDGLASDFASHFTDAANSAPNRLVVTFPARYTSSKAFCERPEKQSVMERIASEIAGQKLKISFVIKAGDKQEVAAQPRSAVTARQRERDALQHPFVQAALEVFSAEVKSVSGPKPK